MKGNVTKLALANALKPAGIKISEKGKHMVAIFYDRGR